VRCRVADEVCTLLLFVIYMLLFALTRFRTVLATKVFEDNHYGFSVSKGSFRASRGFGMIRGNSCHSEMSRSVGLVIRFRQD